MSSGDLTSGSESTDGLPSIFVNKAILPNLPRISILHNAIQQLKYTKGLMLDGIGVTESEDTERFRQFEVYSCDTMEEYTEDVDTSARGVRYLEYSIQDAPHGVIVNSNVFLNYQNWNTLVYESETTFSCVVCGVYCDEEHIILDSHKVNLSKHKPLYQYDLSIVRKIDDKYHCGVCNSQFHISQGDEHFTSEEHGATMLSALNKVSDILYDTQNVNTDSYHFNAKAINNNNIDVTSDGDSEYNDYGNSYADLKYADDNEDVDDDDFYDNVEPPVSLEHSYASMARKPKTDALPQVLEIDLGNKKVTVNYNSWNMVIRPKANRYYCMVCTAFGHARQQAEHCRSLGHVERLAQCRVVDMYQMYLVRQVDDKLYHCGHCNNLQLINEMEDHIESQHPANRQTHTDPRATSHPPTPVKNAKNNNDDKENSKIGINNSTVRNAIAPRNQENRTLNMYNELKLANSDINDDIVICAYGVKVRISKMAFNIVCARVNDYYCGLCEVSVAKERIKIHVNDLQHLLLLQKTPFIAAFNLHLFRQIRDALHCALCNELIRLNPTLIIRHKFEPRHIQCFEEATNQIKSDKVPAPVKSAEKPASTNAGSQTVEAKVSSKVKAVSEKVKAQNDVKSPVKDDKLNTVTTKDMGIENAKAEASNDSTEFIEVKNGAKDIDSDSENASDSEPEEFDFEEHVYVKLGNVFIKITNTAYNTLVSVGDGTKYCFVCAFVVEKELKKHVQSRGHLENMEKCQFLDKYKEDLLRQIYLMYHCAICNVLVTRKQLTQHLSWPTHVLQTDNTKVAGKQRKADIKSGVKQYAITTTSENIYLNETETKARVYLNVAMIKESAASVARKNKIVIFNDNVLKISFEAWHGLGEVGEAWRCKVCQCDLGAEVASHVASDWHRGNLEKFEKKYKPALVRKINDTTLNCVMCNMEVSNKKHTVLEHIQGRRHKKNFDAILAESSVANSYADCDEDVLTL